MLPPKCTFKVDGVANAVAVKTVIAYGPQCPNIAAHSYSADRDWAVLRLAESLKAIIPY